MCCNLELCIMQKIASQPSSLFKKVEYNPFHWFHKPQSGKNLVKSSSFKHFLNTNFHNYHPGNTIHLLNEIRIHPKTKRKLNNFKYYKLNRYTKSKCIIKIFLFGTNKPLFASYHQVFYAYNQAAILGRYL